MFTHATTSIKKTKLNLILIRIYLTNCTSYKNNNTIVKSGMCVYRDNSGIHFTYHTN